MEMKGKPIKDTLSFKYQMMEELEEEIEDLEEQKTQKELDEQEFLADPEVLQEDYGSDYADKFLEHGDNLKIREQDIEEATVTVSEESVDTGNIETKDDKLEEDDEGCDGPEYDDFYGEFCPREHRAKRDATDSSLTV